MSGAPEYELVGVLHAILPPIQLRPDRIKLPFVVLSDTPQPQLILLEAYTPLAEKLRILPLSEKIRVRFTLEGRLWHPPQGQSRYVTRLVAIAVERLSA
ncbi:MAG: hypothetical protein N3A68_00130 [Bacteroidia bacterium]|jgi:hypothetical protein|nr:hypothetical protein [Bacteroidia bacterium]GIV23718.1 MAG: hypothetical protein KatS3mg025_1377 [Bacteroidia bacterium]